MRILFFISSMQAGGAERVASVLLGELVKRDHEIVLAQWSSRDFFYLLPPSIKTISLDLNRKRPRIFSVLIEPFRRIITIRKTINKLKPDLILSFLTRQNCYTLISTRFLKIPVIVSEHNYRYAKLVNKRLDILRQLTYPLANARIVLTEGDRNNYPLKQIYDVIPNPVNVPAALIDIKRTKTIIAVGRLTYQKGFDLLLDAFSKIRDKHNYLLKIIGDGEERKSLEKQAHDLDIFNRVEFVGKVNDIFTYYQEASFLVLSSRYEGFGMVLVEALAFGCPVISFDCPFGPSDIIQHESNGLLVPNGNIDELALAITRLITDKELCKRLSEKGPEIRNRYSINKITDMWESVFERVTIKS